MNPQKSKSTICISLAAFVAVVLLSALPQANAATYLTALGWTQEEKNIWNQRRTNGPYKTVGDVSTNSPGDWTRIEANKNSFMADPDAHRWNGQGTGCVPGSFNLNRTFGTWMHDAALYYFLTGDTAVRTAIRNELIAQAGVANVNFANTTIFCNNGTDQLDIPNWIFKLLISYDFIRNDISSSDQVALDAWFLAAGNWLEANVHNIIDDRWPNRKSDDYSGAPALGTDLGAVYNGGMMVRSFHRAWLNKTALMARTFGGIGIVVNDSALKTEAKRFVKEAIRYNIAYTSSGNTVTHVEYFRWNPDPNENIPNLGYHYVSSSLISLTFLAERFARLGDAELITYSSSAGYGGTEGGPKTLLAAVQTHLDMGRGAIVRCGRANAADCGNANAGIDYHYDGDSVTGWSTGTNGAWNTVEETTPATILNLFHRSAAIKAGYMRTAPGSLPYPSSGGNIWWDGDYGALPAQMFMFAQMEDLVNPYPGGPAVLAGHWKLDETSGTNANDETSNNNDGGLTGFSGSYWVAGQIGGGLSFDGVDDLVTVGNGATTTFDNLPAITVAAWIKATNLGEGSAGRIMEKTSGLILLLNTNNRLDFTIDYTTTDLKRQTADNAIVFNTWQHVAATWNGSATATNVDIYINGVEVGSYATTTNGAGARVSDAAGSLYIGNRSAGDRTFNGLLDDVRIYNGVLSASEILALAQATPPDITTTSLPSGRTTISYGSQQLTATGGTTPYTWSLDSGSLPNGLTGPTSGGVISGTPTTVETANFTARVTDAASQTDTQPLSITINANSIPDITTTTLPDAGLGVAYNQSVASTGGDVAWQWSVLTGSLPTWATLSNANSQNATISGTPTALGTSNFTLQLADVDGDSDTQALSIVVTGDTTPPTGVAVTAPLAGAIVAGTAVTVSGTASDNVGVVGVQFKLDGANLGAEDTTSPYGITWDTTTATNGTHSLTAVARDAAGNTTTSAAITVTVDNAAPTGVAVTAPLAGAIVAGTAVTVSGTASDNVGVVGVQFKLDGANLGAEDTTSPYGITWDTTTTTNGAHSLTAVARDAAGNTTTSSAVSVTVGNLPAAPSGLTATDVAYNQINLAWTDNASTETGFKIERKKGAGGTYSQIGTAAANATSYNDTTAGTGTTYYYRVRANNTYGDSAYSNEANDTTPEVTGRRGHWKLDETTGTTAADASGNANTGTLANGPTWVAGKIGNGLNFDGTNDVVSCGSGTTLDNLVAQGGGGMSIAAWVNVAGMGGGGFGRILQKGNGGNPTAGWRLVTQGTNQIEFSCDYSTTDVSRKSASNALPLNTWKHILVTWNGSTTATNIHIYVDGVEVSYALTTNGSGTRGDDNASNQRIGNSDLGTHAVNGKFDDARIYNRVLTAAEIQAVHRAGL